MFNTKEKNTKKNNFLSSIKLLIILGIFFAVHIYVFNIFTP